ncbi:hypothetical protein [Aromatoleum evansii]|uniref:hypothetical protein n=1 Tax=Aromatoleum evansii TaxID=59406 RepID=UPI00145F56C4|nr:hypothetical protein [Aromatoleum evansii]NMG29701.1 hypothetical protein [Aromatoleum evansii]
MSSGKVIGRVLIRTMVAAKQAQASKKHHARQQVELRKFTLRPVTAKSLRSYGAGITALQTDTGPFFLPSNCEYAPLRP